MNFTAHIPSNSYEGVTQGAGTFTGKQNRGAGDFYENMRREDGKGDRLDPETKRLLNIERTQAEQNAINAYIAYFPEIDPRTLEQSRQGCGPTKATASSCSIYPKELGHSQMQKQITDIAPIIYAYSSHQEPLEELTSVDTDMCRLYPELLEKMIA